MARARGMLFGAVALASLAAGAALVACFDVLHSTSDIRTACEIDPGQAACVPDFCAWSPEEAEAHALHACAWLGACETPMGNNAFGPCMFHARMAYDCRANPNHAPRGPTHDLWACLETARSCGDIDGCVFEQHKTVCASSPPIYSTCHTTLADLRFSCDTEDGGHARPHGENCALWGKSCDPASSRCTGRAAGPTCARGCEDGGLHWCSVDPNDPLAESPDGAPPVDLGLDCEGSGAGACAAFDPGAGAAPWVACEPDTAGGRCALGTSASCRDGVASTCLTGHVETLDCKTLLGSSDACVPGPLAPTFDWTSPCSVSPPACTGDTCDGDTLRSCERGAPFLVSCSSQGLGACRLLTAEAASPPRAACAPPGEASSSR